MQYLQVDFNDDQHCKDWLQLLNDYALDPMGGASSLSQETQERLVDEMRCRPWVHALLAYREADEGLQAVGLLNCIESFSTFSASAVLNIHDVYVAACCRGEGVVDGLFEQAETLALKLQCCKMTLEILPSNTPAKMAYQRLGFRGYTLGENQGCAELWQKYLLEPRGHE